MKQTSTNLARVSALGIAGLCLLASARADIIYQNDFESGTAANFTPGPVILAPNASTRFLGRFSGSGPTGAVLSLSGLASHTSITLNLDLYIIQSWDGNGEGGSGPDSFNITADSTTLLNATFCNWSPTQSYSDATPLGGGPFAAKTDSDAENTLGYSDFFGTNTVYNLSFTFAHSDSSLNIAFTGINLQGEGDESWGLDNFVVTSNAVPEPATIAALAIGGLALARRRRR